jgi:hypothetical protein
MFKSFFSRFKNNLKERSSIDSSSSSPVKINESDNCCPTQNKEWYQRIWAMDSTGKPLEASQLAKSLCLENQYHHCTYSSVSPSTYEAKYPQGLCYEEWSCWFCDFRYQRIYYREL